MKLHQSLRQLNIPLLYATEEISTKDKMIYAHFIFGNCHWFVAEFAQRDTCFGFVILNGDFQNAEWGYFSLHELQEVTFGNFRVTPAPNWTTQPAKNVKLITLAGGIQF
jgi:hypothetical protein